jgi:hypothetical protein
MPINGQINLITNQTQFFAPILLGSGNPTSGFAPLTGQSFQVTMLGVPSSTPLVHSTVAANINPANGTFVLPEFSAASDISAVALNLVHVGQPFYRSQVFKYTRAKEGGLNIYLFQPILPTSDGVAASAISKALSGANLPGNTTLSANPWGIGVVGSKSGADIQFGIRIIPHTSTNLSIFIDLALEGWNIHVGFPADWCTTAHDILNQIRAALGSEDAEVNVFVKNQILQILQILQRPPVGLNASLASALFNRVSITFSSIMFPIKHIWPLSNTNDGTVVMTVQPTLGYPRGW